MHVHKSFTLIAIIFAGACGLSKPSHTSLASQIVEYQINSNTYGIVVPQEEDVSLAQVKQVAREKAAEITVDKGYRYFTIQAEEQTQLIKSDKDWPSSEDFPTNLYQELIIQQDFGKESIERQNPPSSSIVPAYRLVFQMHAERPSQKSIDACTLTECN